MITENTDRSDHSSFHVGFCQQELQKELRIFLWKSSWVPLYYYISTIIGLLQTTE